MHSKAMSFKTKMAQPQGVVKVKVAKPPMKGAAKAAVLPAARTLPADDASEAPVKPPAGKGKKVMPWSSQKPGC